MTAPEPSSELEPALTAAEKELIERLEEACALEPEVPGDPSTGELVRLGDALSAAARAAEHAIALRQQRRARTPAGPSGVREFRDSLGREWRMWAVTPSERSERPGSLGQLRSEYKEGWLAFEALDESERRRLPAYPADWFTRSDNEVEQLLARASPVSRRRSRRPGDPDEANRS